MNATANASITGTLNAYAETGTEGVLWAFIRDGVPGYEGLYILKPGDRLRIYGAHGVPTWEGTVDLEFQRRHRPYPTNPEMGQQEIHGMWVHGFQKTLSPSEWADPFLQEAPAVLEVHASDARDQALSTWADDLAGRPLETWQRLKASAPELAQSMLRALQHARVFRAQELNWPIPSACVTESEEAFGFLGNLALDRARRATWEPIYPSEAQKRARIRWPQPFLPEEMERWAQQSLPADRQPIAP